MPEETLTLLFSHIDPLYELHAAFLKDIEQRMATWYENSFIKMRMWLSKMGCGASMISPAIECCITAVANSEW